MVLHIGVDCEDKMLNNEIVDRLRYFFEKKSYKVTYRIENSDYHVNRILNEYNVRTHEKLLLSAFNRSLCYYSENLNLYDLCFWNGTILTDFMETNQKIPKNYIKQINKFFPNLDLYLTISYEEIDNFELPFNLNHKIIIYDEENGFTNVVKSIFDNLPRCQWCGKLFTKSRQNKKYCSSKCKKYALEEQYRQNNRNYYHRYKNVMSERSKGQLGSRGANLHGTADLNPLREMEKIRKAKKALGLKPIQ